MATIKELKAIRSQEAKKLLMENKLINEKSRIERDIKRIRKARMKDKNERQRKANETLIIIKKKGLKVGKAIISFLQDVRDKN